MKKFATLAVAAAALVLTAGCTAPGTPAEPSAPPLPTSQYDGSGSTEGPTPNKTIWDFQTPAMKDKVFYTEARKGTTALKGFENDKLVIISQLTCASLANGNAGKAALLKQAIMSATGSEEGLSADVSRDLTNVLKVGTRNYCPDLEATLTKALA
ncbi:hypothetical protein Achl_3991 (plasmid) [Pseudarthrobacter chlorophenolicus A6]|uniref:DUF732 domain-containing protein n=1 Tax=Pseudarthrobacter chlorophenolicus (strain ATCC 700700 / DSM 12829 / CIP 107037 / JCM 12360 / KCTC 9906 / NCIMB 13794 / A6) TaxID=452863 RepID=B8HHP5_PSECP|nr:hypothetical protein [Pseudarthrobacter chlorophenolicus]ACL41942.1 hypothetical protein Achl_3991 [Pseudarthrobacter chlorophenolicus A6]SDQ19189.1 hypothetical protein SAMN04489738_0641 [Pseudarthrobacter chlorophenolicus]